MAGGGEASGETRKETKGETRGMKERIRKGRMDGEFPGEDDGDSRMKRYGGTVTAGGAACDEATRAPCETLQLNIRPPHRNQRQPSFPRSTVAGHQRVPCSLHCGSTPRRKILFTRSLRINGLPGGAQGLLASPCVAAPPLPTTIFVLGF